MAHRRRGQRGSSPTNLCPPNSTSSFWNHDYRNRNAEPLPSSEEQEALPIWGTHGLLHAKNLKVISTAGALTAALLHCQPFHVGIKHHLIVSTKIISNSQKASTTCHVQASELRSSWRTGAVSHRLWHHCTGICVQPALYLQFQSFSCSTPGRKSPALATTFPELLPATPHSISSPKKSSAESPRKNQQLNEALKQNTTENTLTKAVFPELDKPPKSTICKTIWRQTGRHMMSSKKVCQPSAEEYNKCVGSVLDGWEIWVLPRKQENWTHSRLTEVSARASCQGHDSRERSHRSQALTPLPIS